MNSCEEPQVFIVDVCGTLVRDDTTIGLLEYFFNNYSQSIFRIYLFKLFRIRFSPIRVLYIILERMTGKHFYKHAVLKLLSGVSVEEMESCANSYAQWLLNNRKVKSVWAILNKRGSAPIILASASLDPVVKALANLLQVSYVASELEQFNGLYTGKYKRDLTGQKDNALIAQYPDLMSGKKICVISDNLTDKNLITEAACPYVVLHNQSHRMRWGDINATFIGLNR